MTDPTFDPHDAVVAPLRALHARLRADEARAIADARRCNGNPAPLLAELRARYAEQADTLTAAALLALREHERTLAQRTTTAHVVETLRQRPGATAPDPGRLGRTAVAELMQTAEATSDPIELDEVRRELGFRVGEGADLAGEAAAVARRLDAVVAGLPDVQRWTAERETVAIALRNAELTRRAIADGTADEGPTEDLHRDLSARLSRGEITTDDVRAVLNAQPQFAA